MFKNITIILSVSALVALSAYGFASGGNLTFNSELTFVTDAGSDMYLDTYSSHKNILVYSSNFDISSGSIRSLCDIDSSFLDSYKNLYFFEIDYSRDLGCRNGNVVMKVGDDIYGNTIHGMNIFSGEDIFGRYIDYSTEDLVTQKEELQNEISELAIFKNYNNENISKYYKFYLGKRRYENALYIRKVISDILDGRTQKYLNPVPGREFSDNFSKIPNSPRPYRESYTDGIHRGWDIDGQNGDRVIALDDGIIVRIVEGFDNNSDFSKIVHGDNLSIDQELKNLDVLRGNQVWLKTLKGDVVFYSHLSSIHSEIKEGSRVSRGQDIGMTGISGVPEVGYDDYHLHFSVMKNPYNILTAGNYDFGDYMSWDWYGKGMGYNDLIQLRKDTFE